MSTCFQFKNCQNFYMCQRYFLLPNKEAPGKCLSFEIGMFSPYLLKLRLLNEKKISVASELTNLRSISG